MRVFGRTNYSLTSHNNLLHPIDLYLQEPNIDPSRENQNLNGVLSKYGYFWLYNGVLYYRNPDGHDIPVDKLEIGKIPSQGELIARINGQTVPLIALAQLRSLIKLYGQNTIYSDLGKKIEKYHSELNRAINHGKRLSR